MNSKKNLLDLCFKFKLKKKKQDKMKINFVLSNASE